MDEILDSLWVEKYRPKELTDVVMEDKYRTFFEKCIYNKEIPNLLFYGSPGGGKSCTSRILVDKIINNDMDLLKYNGSNETGINKIRDDVESFLRCPPMASKHKIIYIEEFERLSGAAQSMLKDVFEKYSSVGRFICNTNHKSKVDSALVSRFQVFEFKKLSNEYIFDYCKKILDAENVKFKVDDVKMLIDNVSPDVRKCVQILQQSSQNGELKNLDKDSMVVIEKKIIGLIIQICDDINNKDLINRNISDIQNEICNNEVDYPSIYEELFNSNIPLWGKISINKYCNKHQESAIPQIHFCSMIWEIILNGTNYIRTFGVGK